MREWLENFIKELVQFPDRVSVSQNEGIKTVVMNVRVAGEDLAQFEGRNNRLTRSLNAAVSLTGAKTRMRYLLRFVD